MAQAQSSMNESSAAESRRRTNGDPRRKDLHETSAEAEKRRKKSVSQYAIMRGGVGQYARLIFSIR